MANNVYISPDQQRSDYERVVGIVADAFGVSIDEFKAKYKIMRSNLLMAAYLNTGLSQYSLSPRKGVDTAIPGTVLLDMNDFFAVDSVGLRFGRAAYASGVYSNHGNYPKLTYPDPVYFSGTGTTAGDEWKSLQTIVNGFFALNVNNDSQIENLLAQDLTYNPGDTYSATGPKIPQFGGILPNHGFTQLTPNTILDGSADNQFVISLSPQGAKGNIDGAVSSGTTDSGVRNILYIAVTGWKIKNLAGNGVQCNAKV